MPTRRTVAALGAASLASACATLPLPRLAQRTRLAPVNVSRDRIIRIDVGLRPYRPNGFRVARETIGAKTVIHNYGHGGGGITLSWGTSKLALDLGYDAAQTNYAVLGCGAVGLAMARLLQEQGAKVRIYAKDVPPDVTSNVAGAQWWPASVYEGDPGQAFHDQLVQACHFSHRRFQGLVGEEYGVEWEANYDLSAHPITSYPAAPTSGIRDLVINQHDLTPNENPFAAPYVRRFDTMMVETPNYLRHMVEDVRVAGGEIVQREFRDAGELQGLPERTIFNCTGLGAGALFSDTEIMPVRGTLVILLPQPEVNYNVLSGGLYMFGRRDGILLGGTFDHNEWSMTPDPATVERIIQGNAQIFNSMRR